MDTTTISAADLKTLNDQGYTTNDLEMLADTEVKALLVPERTESVEDPHDAAARAQDETAAAAAQAAAAADDKPDGEAAAAGNAATTTTTTEEDAHVEEEPAFPQFKAEVPADVDKKISDLRTEEATAFKRLMDGELDAEEYQKVKQRVEGEVDTLKTQALTATIFQQANTQAAEQQAEREWKRAENAALNSFKDEGLDYRSKPALLAAYNVHLKALANDPKNERKDAAWFLSEAHRLTKADLGITTTTKAGNVATTPPANGSRGVDLNEIPPTLRGVPTAASGNVNSDEFAHLRVLMDKDPLEFERAVAKLTDAQRDRWMAE